MPRILLDGIDMRCNIQQIMIDVKVHFSPEYWKGHQLKCNEKMKELEEELGEVLKKYFPDYGSERMSNHEYNTRMSNF